MGDLESPKILSKRFTLTLISPEKRTKSKTRHIPIVFQREGTSKWRLFCLMQLTQKSINQNRAVLNAECSKIVIRTNQNRAFLILVLSKVLISNKQSRALLIVDF